MEDNDPQKIEIRQREYAEKTFATRLVIGSVWVSSDEELTRTHRLVYTLTHRKAREAYPAAELVQNYKKTHKKKRDFIDAKVTLQRKKREVRNECRGKRFDEKSCRVKKHTDDRLCGKDQGEDKVTLTASSSKSMVWCTWKTPSTKLTAQALYHRGLGLVGSSHFWDDKRDVRSSPLLSWLVLRGIIWFRIKRKSIQVLQELLISSSTGNFFFIQWYELQSKQPKTFV